MPDSVFVEDTAIVLDELAIITRPGTESRREEVGAISETLRKYRSLSVIKPPGTLEGGDVLKIGRTLFVGITGRTNDSGIQQLVDQVSPHGYEVERVEVKGCLHLKSAVTYVGDEMLLINKTWVDTGPFRGKDLIDVDPDELYGANALFLENELIYPANFPRTHSRLLERNIKVKIVDVSELQKAEGAVTCCSIIFQQ
jgi:dimethylargininase